MRAICSKFLFPQPGPSPSTQLLVSRARLSQGSETEREREKCTSPVQDALEPSEARKGSPEGRRGAPLGDGENLVALEAGYRKHG